MYNIRKKASTLHKRYVFISLILSCVAACIFLIISYCYQLKNNITLIVSSTIFFGTWLILFTTVSIIYWIENKKLSTNIKLSSSEATVESLDETRDLPVSINNIINDVISEIPHGNNPRKIDQSQVFIIVCELLNSLSEENHNSVEDKKIMNNSASIIIGFIILKYQYPQFENNQNIKINPRQALNNVIYNAKMKNTITYNVIAAAFIMRNISIEEIEQNQDLYSKLDDISSCHVTTLNCNHIKNMITNYNKYLQKLKEIESENSHNLPRF